MTVFIAPVGAEFLSIEGDRAIVRADGADGAVGRHVYPAPDTLNGLFLDNPLTPMNTDPSSSSCPETSD